MPQTIVVLTDLFLKEMSVDKLSDAIQMVGGVPVAATRNQDRFSIRGIATAQQYVDGFRDVQEWGGGEFAQVQQLEIIKGPETNLFGNAFALGGIINRITKRPKPDQWTELDFTGGSYDYYRTTLDTTGPVNESKTLLYRVNAAYTSSGSFRDLHDSMRAYASPVFEWKPTKTTDLTVFTEFMYERHQEDNFIPTVTNAAGQQVLTVPISRSIDEPWQKSIIRKQSVRATLDQKFGDHITARLAGFQTYINNPIQQVEYLGIEADQRTIDRRAFGLNRHEHYQYLEADLIGNFKSGPITHQVSLSADWFHTEFRSNVRRAPLASIDLYNPVYGAPLPDFFVGPGAVLSTNTLGNQGDRGYGGSYQAGLFNDRLLLIGSSRRDVVTSRRELQVTPYQDIHDSPNKKTAPRYGVVVKPLKQVSLYYQYAEAMQANLGAGFRLDGSALDPTTGVSREFGAKTSFMEDHLQISLASFDVRVVNLPVRLDPPNTSFFANSGSNRSTGEELNVTYNDSNLTVMAGWVNQNVRPTTGGVQGPPIPGTPKSQAQLFARYHWGVRNYAGFTLGGGVVYQTSKPLTATAGSQELPGFETYNLNASYSFNKSLKLALSVSNLLDKQFIVASNGTLWSPGDPRTIKLTLTKIW